MKQTYQQSLGIHAMPKDVEEKLMRMFPILRRKWYPENLP